MVIVVRRWTVMSSIGLIAVAVAVVVPPGYRFLALGIAVLFDVLAAARAGQGEWRLHSGHFAERHGLFVIIALGDPCTAAGITASGQAPTAVLLGVALYRGDCRLCLVVDVLRMGDGGARRLPRQATSGKGPGVLPVTSIPSATSRSLPGSSGSRWRSRNAWRIPSNRSPPPSVIALITGVGLFIGGVALALLLSGCRVSRWRLVVLGLLAVAAPFLPQLPAWGSLAVVTLLVASLALVDRPPVSWVPNVVSLSMGPKQPENGRRTSVTMPRSRVRARSEFSSGVFPKECGANSPPDTPQPTACTGRPEPPPTRRSPRRQTPRCRGPPQRRPAVRHGARLVGLSPRRPARTGG